MPAKNQTANPAARQGDRVLLLLRQQPDTGVARVAQIFPRQPPPVQQYILQKLMTHYAASNAEQLERLTQELQRLMREHLLEHQPQLIAPPESGDHLGEGLAETLRAGVRGRRILRNGSPFQGVHEIGDLDLGRTINGALVPGGADPGGCQEWEPRVRAVH